MLATNGSEINGRDYFGRREDLSFIVRFNWKTSHHLKEAIQVLLAARLSEGTDCDTVSGRRRQSDLLDDNELRDIRLQIAGNPNTPPAVLAYLCSSDDDGLLERIAGNPRASEDTLQRLARHASPAVRAAVAENPNVTPDILTMLGNDPHVDVRYSLAENPNLPEELLLGLAEDPNPYVCTRAAATLSRMQGGAVVEGSFVRAARDDRIRHSL